MIRLVLALLSMGLLAAMPCRAQTVQGRGTVALNVGEGRLLRLDRTVNHVLVGDSAIADVQVVSPQAVYVYGRAPGETTLTATDASSGVAAQLRLRVRRSAQAAQAALPAGASIALRFEGNRMVVSGPVSNLGQAMEVEGTARAYNPDRLPPLDMTRLAGAQQVTLRVRIAEVSRTKLQQLGLNLSVLANPGSFTFNLLTGTFLGSGAAGGASSSLINGLGNAPNAPNFANATVGINGARVNAQALLNALESEGVLTTLAEPNLTTISGETANFLAGGEVPIPVPQSFGVTTIEYKRFGVQLAFTPTLLPGDRIAMRVRPEVSQISNANEVNINGTVVPSFITRSTETNVEMASGQTLAIAGLFQRTEQNTLQKFPGLGDVPILGALFRSTAFQRDETELVILITPYLTQPVSSPGAYTLPTDTPYATPAAPEIASGFVAN